MLYQFFPKSEAVNILERYSRNQTTFSEAEQKIILTKHVCVIGCGGLGGHVISQLIRFGVRAITVVDGDNFALSNLNRQLFCTEENLGESKAKKTSELIAAINSDVEVIMYAANFSGDNAEEILCEVDLVFDCLDNVPTRLLLEKMCTDFDKVLIHGAIAGFYGQIATVFPGENILALLYQKNFLGIETKLGNPAFTPALVASLQVCEGLKFLAGHKKLLREKLLFVDLKNYEFEFIKLL